MVNNQLKSATMLLFIFSNVMVVILTMTKIIEAITTQRQTQQDVLAGQDVIKQNPLIVVHMVETSFYYAFFS